MVNDIPISFISFSLLTLPIDLSLFLSHFEAESFWFHSFLHAKIPAMIQVEELLCVDFSRLSLKWALRKWFLNILVGVLLAFLFILSILIWSF